MLDPILVKIIDTPQFQRLRNIKQLGGCYFVYPSASHNRFEHSIGTCFLASKLAHQLKQRLDQDIENLKKSNDTAKEKYAMKLEKAKMTEEDLLCIEIAGLCHDIGHGPYSHLFDRLFNKAMKKKDPKTKEWQDKIKDNKARYYMYEIVANKRNEIDVDKMDYFARDCHGLGMKSNFDHLRFISQCKVMFSSDTPDETTIAFETKFTDVLVEANDHLLFKNKSGHTVKMSEAWEYLEVYEKLTDSVFDEILMKEDPDKKLEKAKELINNVYKRNLYSLVDETSPVKKVTYSYGMGPRNPITSVYFYTKDNDTDCFPRTKPEKNDANINVLKKETTKCLIKVELDSVKNSAIEQEHQGNAANLVPQKE
ncbi:SAMHD1 [Mytilus coruscus]|uniref:SAMHD1 n=1 Tax=Mytilus coruscus TaxID=42192 RepID=A0A6J8DTN0_MYTCO|nr:SAMHD1 [Mytilus coruscus]